MALDGASLVTARATRGHCEKTQQQRLFPEIMTPLLNIIHTLCCGLFTEGTTLFTYHYADGNVLGQEPKLLHRTEYDY